MFPSQLKSLLSTLGVLDRQDDQMIFFHVEKSKNPPIPSSISFQIPISIRNAIVQGCIIHEGASTYVMVANVWKKIGYTNLSPSTITLRAWDGHPSHPLGLYHNCPVTIVDNILCIDIKVIDAPLDYNIIWGCGYTYIMSVVAMENFSS